MNETINTSFLLFLLYPKYINSLHHFCNRQYKCTVNKYISNDLSWRIYVYFALKLTADTYSTYNIKIISATNIRANFEFWWVIKPVFERSNPWEKSPIGKTLWDFVQSYPAQRQKWSDMWGIKFWDQVILTSFVSQMWSLQHEIMNEIESATISRTIFVSTTVYSSVMYI